MKKEPIDKLQQLKGEFSFTVRDKSGKIIEKYEDKNLIVNAARTSLAQLISNAGPNKYISKIAFGTSGISPDISDTVITNAVIKAVDGVTYPEFNSASFSWTLDYGDANGLNIAEFGLLSNDLTLFARKTRTAIAKTSDLQLQGVWKIVF